jgi:hypothetical protein
MTILQNLASTTSLPENRPDKVYLTPRQLPSRFPAFTESSIRYLIFNCETNGFKKCIKRVGRKLLIDEQQFINWIEAQNA